MPEDTPEFSTVPLEEATPKKTTRKKAVRKTTRPKVDAKSVDRINSNLEAIYRDNKGELPNMKQIKIKNRHPFLRALLFVATIGVFAAMAAWVGFFLLPAGSGFAENKVELSIEGPDSVMAGATTTYTIRYANRQTTPLETAGLTIQYPVGFAFVTSSLPLQNNSHNELRLDTLGPEAEGTLTITGQLYGNQNEPQSWRALLNYQPKALSSRFQKNAALTVTTVGSPISLAITAPAQVVADTDTPLIFSVVIKSPLNNTPPGARLRLTPVLPPNFSLSSSTPNWGKNNYWDIAIPTSTTDKKPQTFKLSGKFSDTTDPVAIKGTVSLVLGENQPAFTIAEQTIPTLVSKNGFLITLAANGKLDTLSTQPGDTLNFTLNLKNTSAAPVTDAVVSLALDTPSTDQKQSLLKWSDITDKADGDIRGEQVSPTIRHGQITWNKKKIPALALLKPGSEVAIEVALPLKNQNDLDLTQFSTYLIKALSSLDITDSSGAQKHLTSQALNITVNSDTSLKVAETATVNPDATELHDITWTLTNNFHALKNIVLTATIFGDVAVLNTTSTPAGTSVYEPQTQKITWTIPTMPSSVDVLSWPFTVQLNKKRPAQNTLVSKVTLTAEDTVTGQTITLSGDEIPLKAE